MLGLIVFTFLLSLSLSLPPSVVDTIDQALSTIENSVEVASSVSTSLLYIIFNINFFSFSILSLGKSIIEKLLDI